MYFFYSIRGFILFIFIIWDRNNFKILEEEQTVFHKIKIIAQDKGWRWKIKSNRNNKLKTKNIICFSLCFFEEIDKV
jgi:hypothetical protein